jgi:hypothetical protein
MLKGVIFTGGLFTGLYLGIYLRQQGFDQNLTKAYYAFQNPKPTLEANQPNPNLLNNIYQTYEKELYDDKQFAQYAEKAKLTNQPIETIIQNERLSNLNQNKQIADQK